MRPGRGKGQLFLPVAVAALAGLATLAYIGRGPLRNVWYEARKPAVPAAVPLERTQAGEERPADGEDTAAAPVVPPAPPPASRQEAIPASYNLDVPWMVQAPFADWTGSYEDACEEASALMVHYYYTKQRFETQEEMKEELDKAFAWEDRRLGYNLDTTAEETAIMLREYFGWDRVELVEDPTAEQIKRHIAAGRPVIVPAYGKALLNPNFRNGGPDYHMLVIKGYTATDFVTNDPGTRRGADYVYPIARLMDAIHDWNGGDVLGGRRVMIVVHP